MKIYKIVILLFFLLLGGNVKSQVSENEIKAAFIERFTRFVEWPDSLDQNDFKIVIFGKTPFKKSLNDLFENTKIKNRDVQVIYTDDLEEINNTNLIFISGSEKKRIHEILSKVDGLPVLTISDNEDYSNTGIHINMYEDKNYIRYEINPKSIKNSKLNVSSLLLSSAKIVETDE